MFVGRHMESIDLRARARDRFSQTLGSAPGRPYWVKGRGEGELWQCTRPSSSPILQSDRLADPPMAAMRSTETGVVAGIAGAVPCSRLKAKKMPVGDVEGDDVDDDD